MKESKSSLENLFNSHLREAEFPFRENDWNDMERKLDLFDDLARGAPNHNLLWLIIPLVVLMFLAGWFSRDFVIKGEMREPTAQSEVKEPTAQFKMTEPHDKLAEQGEAGRRADAPYDVNRRVPSQSPPVQHRTESDQQKSSEITHQSTASSEPPRYGNPAFLESLDDPLMMTRMEIEAPGIYLTDQPTESEHTRVHDSRWSVGIMFAADFNGVGGFENYRGAVEAGILGYYNITKNWRFSTGLLYSPKKYISPGSEYHPPEGYWKYVSGGEVPSEIEAICDILDVPMNITYLFKPSSKVTLTATGGLSHYFILTEDYEYYFVNENPDYPYGWETSQNSSAFFAMLNLGLGVEWHASPGMYINIEPFFKQPLRNVGWGNVRLNSAGISFSVRKTIKTKTR